MKKDYLKPEVERIAFCTVNMLAASTVAEMSAGPQEEAPAAGEKRGAWGDLWK